jgi:hypothetical protein
MGMVSYGERSVVAALPDLVFSKEGAAHGYRAEV